MSESKNHVEEADKRGLPIRMIDIGGGFPIKHFKDDTIQIETFAGNLDAAVAAGAIALGAERLSLVTADELARDEGDPLVHLARVGRVFLRGLGGSIAA